MESSNESHTGKTPRKRSLIVAMACILLLVAGNIAYRAFVPPLKVEKAAKPSLPDLRGCTRMEIRFEESALDYISLMGPEDDVLSPAEMERLRLLRMSAIDDPRRIKAATRKLHEASHIGHERDWPGPRYVRFQLVCYQDSRSLASLFVSYRVIDDESGQRFRLDKGGLDTAILTPEVKPFALRTRCGYGLREIGAILRSGTDGHRTFPLPSDWCDNVIRYDRATNEDNRIYLRCPGARKGKCHYAMNPHCKPDSPEDMVFLFEAKPGWNRHGGPELFTFDNHDPKGGCVLLNDGTVKFVRTEEELHALRWR